MAKRIKSVRHQLFEKLGHVGVHRDKYYLQEEREDQLEIRYSDKFMRFVEQEWGKPNSWGGDPFVPGNLFSIHLQLSGNISEALRRSFNKRERNRYW